METTKVYLSTRFLPFLRAPLLFFRLNESNKTTDFAVVLCQLLLAAWIEFTFWGVKSSCFRFGSMPENIPSPAHGRRMPQCGCCVTFSFTMQREDSVVRVYAISSTRLYANKTVFFPFGIFPFYVAMHKSVSCKRRSMTVVLLTLISDYWCELLTLIQWYNWIFWRNIKQYYYQWSMCNDSITEDDLKLF